MNSSWPSLVAAADQQVLIRHLNTQIHCRMKRVIAFCLLINRKHHKPLFFLIHGIKHLTAVQWSDQELIDSLIQICSSTLSKLSALLNVFLQKQQNTADYLERRAFLVSSHVKDSLTDLRTITSQDLCWKQKKKKIKHQNASPKPFKLKLRSCHWKVKSISPVSRMFEKLEISCWIRERPDFSPIRSQYAINNRTACGRSDIMCLCFTRPITSLHDKPDHISSQDASSHKENFGLASK